MRAPVAHVLRLCNSHGDVRARLPRRAAKGSSAADGDPGVSSPRGRRACVGPCLESGRLCRAVGGLRGRLSVRVCDIAPRAVCRSVHMGLAARLFHGCIAALRPSVVRVPVPVYSYNGLVTPKLRTVDAG